MKFSISATLATITVALAGCGAPSPERIAAASFTLSEAQQPVKYFSDACLKSLPEFSGFQNAVTELGFTPVGTQGSTAVYKAPGDKLLTASVLKEGDALVCGIGFLGPEDSAEVGAMFLQEAIKRTGGKPKEKFPTSQRVYAYQLNNGSVISYEVRKKGAQLRHIVAISKPVPKEDVAEYLYN